MSRLIMILFAWITCFFAKAQMPDSLQSGGADSQIKFLTSEITRQNNSISSLTNMIGMISKTCLDLENRLQQQNEEIKKLKSRYDSLTAGKAASLPSDKVQIISNPATERDSIIQTLQLYAAGASVADRLPYILDPERVGKIMDEYYAKGVTPFEVSPSKIKIQGSRFRNNQVFKVYQEGKDYLYYCMKTSQGYKIDWEAYKGYNPLYLNLFQINEDLTKREFRVRARLSGNGLSSTGDISQLDATNWWSLVLDDMQTNFFSCFVEKDSPAGRKIYELLKDMEFHRLIVEIEPFKLPGPSYSPDKEVIEYKITRLVGIDWSKFAK